MASASLRILADAITCLMELSSLVTDQSFKYGFPGISVIPIAANEIESEVVALGVLALINPSRVGVYD